jgi:hypothetical protein
MPVFVGCYICPSRLKNAQPPTSARSFAGGDQLQSSSSLVEFAGNGPANHRRSWGHFVQVNSDLGRGVNEGISANAIHHISAAMIAGYQNNIGMTDLLSRKTPTSDQSSPDHGGVIEPLLHLHDVSDQGRTCSAFPANKPGPFGDDPSRIKGPAPLGRQGPPRFAWRARAPSPPHPAHCRGLAGLHATTPCSDVCPRWEPTVPPAGFGKLSGQRARYGPPARARFIFCVNMQRMLAEGAEWKMPWLGSCRTLSR